MYRKFFKRCIDFIAAFTAVVIFSPLILILIILLSLQNNFQPFFVQKRIGKNNKLFNVIKFKTMNDKKDKNGNLLKDKDRLTTLGKIVRKTSLDEIPQLFNVIKGDMSLVGPRPLLVEYLPYYSDYHIRRHEVLPGITGLAQVNGRNFLKFSERFNLDVEYVDTLSFKLDVLIIYKTAQKVFKSGEISMGRKMSEVDDIGITKGLSKHYFNVDEDEK
ncbi:sugar transferase [Sphingobacterium sp. SGR-19]|uniref:sugar transferase n=1 Tax=Sphingobacterium sp. SGR-19 TaxID=2710886 RepID=UPI0013EA2E94|nr:sugar transferase [Sphingobacterium sp. SGR-19]NGM67214.1 sugar transferase [Sphingobacterium sp. SGR-19]